MPSAENQQQLDIAAERAQCTFNPALLTPLFYGGEEKMRQLKTLEAMIDSEPVFDRDDRYFLGRTEVNLSYIHVSSPVQGYQTDTRASTCTTESVL